MQSLSQLPMNNKIIANNTNLMIAFKFLDEQF